MKEKLLIYPFIIFFLIFDINIAKTEITGNIIAKVGNRIITSFDLENEIKTQLFITQSKINQTQIDKLKTISIKNLVRHAIKDTEIKKYKIKKYNLNDLNNYLDILAKNLGISQANLKQAFKENNISYESHIERNI